MVLSFAKGDANNISTQDSFLQTQEPIPIWEKSPPWRVTNSRWWKIYILYRIKMIFWPKAVIRICYMMKKWENSNYDLKIDCYQAIGRDNICKSLLLSQVWFQFPWFGRNDLPDELYVLKRAPCDAVNLPESIFRGSDFLFVQAAKASRKNEKVRKHVTQSLNEIKRK